MEKVRLLLLDEVHMLNDIRGATLEVVVCRMTFKCGEMNSIRNIGISATIQNIADIAEWLSFSGTRKVYFEKFGEEYTLKTQVIGYHNSFAICLHI